MKIVKDYILLEKFVEDSDPIRDMGIGYIEYVKHKLELEENKILPEIFKGKWYWISHWPIEQPFSNNAINLYDDIRFFDIERVKYELCIIASSNLYDYQRGIFFAYPIKQFEDIIGQINEKFIEDSDPIKDMGIGIFCTHNFKSLEDFNEFLNQNMEYILESNKTPEVLIMTNSSFTHSSMKSYYYDKIKKYIEEYVYINGEKFKSDSSLMYYLAKTMKRGVRLSTAEELKNSHYFLSEKFIEDSDPIKDMNIGTELIYYHFRKTSSAYSIQNYKDDIFYLYIIGKNINITSIGDKFNKMIANNNFVEFSWKPYTEGWISNEYFTEEEWLILAPQLFKYIENTGKYMLVPTKNTEFEISGYNYHE